MDPDPKVSEGEIVNQGSSEILINMEGMIKTLITSIEKVQEEAKKHKEMLDDIFENSPTFKEHSEKSKEAAKTLANTKAQILKQPQAAEMSEKVKSFKSQLKEEQDSLSDYLQEYARMSGLDEIEGEDGKIHKIVYTARLVKG